MSGESGEFRVLWSHVSIELLIIRIGPTGPIIFYCFQSHAIAATAAAAAAFVSSYRNISVETVFDWIQKWRDL